MLNHAASWTSPRRTPALLAVLGLHALLYLAWPRQPALPREVPRPARQPTVLRLLWPSPAGAAAAPAAARPPMPPRNAPAVVQPNPAAPRPVGQAITLPAAGLATAARAAEPPASAPPRADMPLDLRLPTRMFPASPRSAAAEALADPRANSPRPTWEARLERRLDTRVSEEVQPDGSVRLRRGDACLLAQATRGSQLDPFSEHARTGPRSVGSCD